MTKFADTPLKLRPNRVWRSYTGGKLIDRWKDAADPKDGDSPEEWVASTVTARGKDRPDGEGLSVVELPDGTEVCLKDLVETDKEAFLGRNLAQKYGDTALLVKMLDSKERLTIQVHPDKAFAREYLGSEFGKTEGWYVLGCREIDGEGGYVLMGFKEGVTRETWKEMFQSQDIEGMLASLHRIDVSPGDVFIINGGVPHAIGSGCFLLEIQEPTDYTMRVEKTTPTGMKLDPFLVHQGVGEERMLDCFHYDAMDLEETKRRWKLTPKVILDSPQATLCTLIDHTHTDCFALSELIVRSKFPLLPTGAFYTLIVYSGSGEIIFGGQTMPVRAGDEIFVPASAPELLCTTDTNLHLLLCYPPE